jgi:hypothetical protein
MATFNLSDAASKDVRFVDLSKKVTSAKAVREGFAVPAAQVNKEKAAFLIDQLPAAARRDIPRVVTQSIPPGTHVSAGTAVDLVLAPKQSVPFEIFDGVHSDLQGHTLDFLDDVLDNNAVRELTLGFDTPDKMTPAQKKVITDQMAAKDIGVDPDNPDRSFEAMFEGLRAAAAYR